MNLYNEFDPKAAQWLRNLIEGGMIPQGYVDDRSITEIDPDELKRYTQCHFFAGIGGWSYALQLAGWPPERPIWTGSCPCQPFSTAGRQKGQADERHLWPVWFNLIRSCKPDVIMGEQVAAAIGHGWLDGVFDDLEGEGYTCGAAVVPACSVNAPHRRDRLWFVADSKLRRCERKQIIGCRELQLQMDAKGQTRQSISSQRTINAPPSTLGNTEHYGSSGGQVTGSDRQAISDNTQGAECTVKSAGASQSGDVADTEPKRLQRLSISKMEGSGIFTEGSWISCPDGKQRRIEPTIPLLAHGVPARVVKLRALGNAIVPQVAAKIIQAYMDLE